MRHAACCRAFTLSKPLKEIKADREKYGPDVPLIVDIVEEIGDFRINPESGYDYGREVMLHRCKVLGPDERCTIYERRPAMCRSFQCVGPRACLEFPGCPSLGNGCTGGDCRVTVVDDEKAVEESACATHA